MAPIFFNLLAGAKPCLWLPHQVKNFFDNQNFGIGHQAGCIKKEAIRKLRMDTTKPYMKIV